MDIRRKPEWLKIDFRSDNSYSLVSRSLKKNCLHTICISGRCPNLAECWSRGTATFMILGDICTRSCGFCNTKTGRPLPTNPEEPKRLAASVRELGIKQLHFYFHLFQKIINFQFQFVIKIKLLITFFSFFNNSF